MHISTANLDKIPKTIREKIGVNLHLQPYHPLQRLGITMLESFTDFQVFDRLDPVVTVENNFDRLLIPQDHPSRKSSDTYYLDDKHVLRTHTSAHQSELLKRGFRKFVVIGDVYRKDEIDRTHYPIFHQIEGVAVYPDSSNIDCHLHEKMTAMISSVMPGAEIRKVDSYFPFTHPSWEYEVKWEGKWLEIAGCGIMQPKILEEAGMKGRGR